MNESTNVNPTKNLYLGALQKAHLKTLETAVQVRICASDLLTLGNDIDADKLRGFVDAIETMDDTTKHLQWLIDREHKMMSAKPGDIIAWD